MDSKTIETVQTSWQSVAPIAPQAAQLFYANLFALDPEVKNLFKTADMASQGEKLMQMIGAAVGLLGDLETLVPILKELAVRHLDYGVTAEHYNSVGTALLQTLEQGLGEAFTPEVRDAWTEVYGVMTSVMLPAAYPEKA